MSLCKNNEFIKNLDSQEIYELELDLRITYRLFKCAGIYLISVKTRDEGVTVSFDTNEAEAQKIFDMFVNSRVTPCTAEDIARDFMGDKIS